MAESQKQHLTVSASEDDVGKRLDVFLAASLDQYSRSKIRKFFDAGLVTKNGAPVKPKHLVEEDDVFEIVPPAEASSELKPIQMDLDILFEDDDIIVLNKPIGLSVHPGAGEPAATLVHGLIYHTKNLARKDQPADRPGIVHRLDKDTSGVMVCAKNDAALAHLSAQFQAKTNERMYIALLDGVMQKNKIRIESYIRRDPKNRLKMLSINAEDFEILRSHSDSSAKQCRFAASKFEKVETYRGRLSLVHVRLETGRTHQIRAHAVALGTPVVGDQRYGREIFLPTTFAKEVISKVNKTSRQMLHAKILGFVHPTTGEQMSFESPLPQDFADLLELLEQHRDLP